MTLQTPDAPKVGTRDAAAAASRVFVRLRQVFGIDLRSLALLRIALARRRGPVRDPARPLAVRRGSAALVAAVGLLGPGVADATLRAERITTENAAELLIGGPDAIGGIGDWYLANDVVEIIVDDPGRQHAKLNHGGTIVDAGLRHRKGDDQFARLFPIVNMDQRVQINFDTMRAEIDESVGWARLTVSSSQGMSAVPRGGALSRWLDLLVPETQRIEKVYVETEYTVLPGEPFFTSPPRSATVETARRRSSPTATCGCAADAASAPGSATASPRAAPAASTT